MTIKAYRGPRSNSRVYSGGDYSCSLRPLVPGDWQQSAVQIGFTVPASKGYSDFMVKIDPESFARLAQAMMDVCPGTAVKAFGAAMVEGCRAKSEVEFYASITDPDPA